LSETKQSQTIPTVPSPPPYLGYALLAGLTIVWGSNWPVMKIALSEIPVWWFRSACLVFGGLGLMAIAAGTGSRLLFRKSEIGPLLLTAVFAVVGWHVCTGYGVSLMPAGRASIVAYTMPVWAAVAGYVLLGERMTWLKMAGLGLGLMGLAVLIGDDLAALRAAPAGVLFMLVAAFSWGMGTALFKRFSWSVPVVTNMAWQLLIASVPVTAVAIASEPLPAFAALSQPVLIALAYVLLLPMTFGQWAYYSIVRMFPTSVAAIGTMAIPIVGVYSSAWVLGEPAGVRELGSLVLVCGALALILVVPNLRAKPAAAQTTPKSAPIPPIKTRRHHR